MADPGSRSSANLSRALAIARDLTVVVADSTFDINVQRVEIHDALREICLLIESATEYAAGQF